MRTIFRTYYILLSSLLLIITLSPNAMAGREIKIASVAPDGSAWSRLFKRMNKEIQGKTKGEVTFHFYPGQVQGDERDVIRKIRTGQLDGGAFTAVGLSMINPKVLVLQMPMMFTTYEQLDRVRDKMNQEFEISFREKGYELLGWGDVGWVYLFSQNQVNNKSDLIKQKVWVWNDDPLSKAMMKIAGVSPRQLGLPQVYPALNTGMVNAVYNAPLACLTLQWHTKVKYFADFPLAIAIGATVISKKTFDAISPEYQKVLKEISAKYHRDLNKIVRRDNDKALQAIRASGIQAIPIEEKWKVEFRQIAAKVAKQFVPRFYPQDLLDRVIKLRNE